MTQRPPMESYGNLKVCPPAQKCSKKVPPEHHVPTFGEQKFHVQPIVCWVPLVSLRMVCMMCVPIFMNAMDDEAS